MKDSKEFLMFILGLGNAGGESMKNGTIDFRDALNFWEPMTLAEDAFDGFQNIYEELLNATPDQYEELYQMSAEKFDIPQDRIERVIEKGIKASLNMIEMVMIWKRD